MLTQAADAQSHPAYPAGPWLPVSAARVPELLDPTVLYPIITGKSKWLHVSRGSTGLDRRQPLYACSLQMPAARPSKRICTAPVMKVYAATAGTSLVDAMSAAVSEGEVS